MRSFQEFYEHRRRQIGLVDSLQALIVWRKRGNIGNGKVSYKSENGYLISHSYTAFRTDKEKELRSGNHHK